MPNCGHLYLKFCWDDSLVRDRFAAKLRAKVAHPTAMNIQQTVPVAVNMTPTEKKNTTKQKQQLKYNTKCCKKFNEKIKML